MSAQRMNKKFKEVFYEKVFHFLETSLDNFIISKCNVAKMQFTW